MLNVYILERKIDFGKALGLRAVITLIAVALSIVVPYFVHAVFGFGASAKFLPMFYSVFILGILLGKAYGLCIGLIIPLISFLLTGMWSEPMPNLARLPFMMIESGCIGLVSAGFADKIMKNKWMSYPAVLIAGLSGRIIFIIARIITGSNFHQVLISTFTGIPALYLQILILPLAIIYLRAVFTGRY